MLRKSNRKALLATAGMLATPASSALAAHPGVVINLPLGGDLPTAVSQAIYAGGGTVNLQAGTYHINSSIPMASNITINGQGSSTIILSPATPHGFAMIGNVEEGIGNIVLANLVLDGNIPQGAYLPGGGGNPYNGAGLYLFANTYPIQPVTLTNVEIRHTSIGILFGQVNGITISNCYIHNNNPGGFAHNAYFVASSGVAIEHSRFNNSWLGDGLHFDFGASGYTITKSEFSGNEGEGVLDQGNQGITITDTAMNGNRNDGLNTGSNGATFERDIASANLGFGYNNGGGSGNAYFLAALDDSGGFGQFFGDNFGYLLGGTSPNVYPAILGDGVIGPADTADWTTAYAGFSTIGAVDFNARHLTGGLLTFPNVGVVADGVYSASLSYSNGTAKTLQMKLGRNGGALYKKIDFPPTGSWTTWRTVTFPVTLAAGGNAIALAPEPAGAPELDSLTINTAVPAAPAAVSGIVAKTKGPYEIDLSWPAPAGAASYAIVRDGTPISYTVYGTHYSDSTLLIGGAAHTYVVYAQNQGGTSGPSETVNVTSPVDTPAGFQAAAATGGNALNWISENGATAFKVRRSLAATGPFQTIAIVTNTASQTSGNYEMTYLDAKARPGTTYYYEVVSIGPEGDSPPSYVLQAGAASDSQHSVDIGQVRGMTDYRPATATFSLSASAPAQAGAADGFHYAYMPIDRHAVMTARVLRVSGGANAAAGIDLRASLAPDAPHARLMLSPGQGVAAMVRSGAQATDAVAARQQDAHGVYWLRATRDGAAVTLQTSPDGLTWKTLGTAAVDLPATAYMGLVISGADKQAPAYGMFDTVQLRTAGRTLALCRNCSGRR